MEASKTALLIMDVQHAIGKMFTDTTVLTNPLREVLAAARAQHILVIYVVVGFRSGYPELTEARKAVFQGMNLDDAAGYKVLDAVAPAPGEVIVVKRRVSAFSGSDLEVILRAKGIQHMVLTGVATSGVVLSTLREASDKDYGLTVLADCCADRDEEVHRVLTTKVFVRQAEVMTGKEWISKIKA